MASYAQISVGVAPPTLIVAANNNRRGLIVDNQGSVTVYIGPDASITSSNTVSLRAGATLTIDDHWIALSIYGVTASGSATVAYWEIAP